MHIRQAEIDDAEELARILNSIIAEGGKTAIDTPLSGPELAEWFITGPHCISCLLADTDEGFLGFQALERFHADLPHDMADIATFVTDRARGSGIGRSLSHATAAIAGENGVQRIRAVIQRSNEDAIHYYRSVGFHDDTANMTSSSVTLIRPTAPGGR
ncbi:MULTISPECIES: GNAT family N-acetyltransferase [Kocuria]|uniref:GNAT family N-acetyltransferase n=1 Tax=Kocuria TaxID=57493 RepID=UPI0008A30930|nr:MULTISPECIES: GNAT family N-acetyltransferase [Kocuria]OFK07544.1 hypothetical protein HMPREF2833_10370 [Kocuria sp. HMSC066H03]PKZ37380.1 GNAT family N-acetyltransferase [Kocuria rhizophila]